LKIYISRGSVATQLRCGGIFNNYVITNCGNKKFRKSVNIWRRYRQKQSGTFFMAHGVFNKSHINRMYSNWKNKTNRS